MRRDSAKLREKLAAAVCALAVFVLPGSMNPSHAAFYKCVGADGSTTYNDTPCDADESTHLLSKSARELSVLDCRIAHNFAFDAVARMRQNDSAIDVFQAYGGAEKLSEGARNLINHVFSFQNNALVSSQRIVDLTVKRCQAGLLSKTLDQCEAFPEDFVARFGSCLKARQIEQTVLIQSPVDDQVSSNTKSGESRTTVPSLNAATPVVDNVEARNSLPKAKIRLRLENGARDD